MSAHPERQGGRIDFIDLLRGWAVIVMIETHVFNATLEPGLLSGQAFQYIKFINGLVAPSFLFASGLAFAVTVHRKREHLTTFSPSLLHQTGRLLSIALIGYLLHIPVLPITKLLSAGSDEQIGTLFQVDILQCIAASLLLLQTLLLVCRTEHRLYIAAGFGGSAMVLLTPLAWGFDATAVLPRFAAAYINGNDHSLFPLFPWAGFLSAGAIAGYIFVSVRERPGGQSVEQRFIQSLAWVGASMILLAYLAGPLGKRWYPMHDFWQTSPSFFLLRLGIVMMLTALLASVSSGKPTAFRTPVLLFGKESLLIYVVHLLILYGTFGPFTLVNRIGSSFGYAEASILAGLLVTVMFGLGRLWNTLRHTSPGLKRLLTFAVGITVAALLLFGSS